MRLFLVIIIVLLPSVAMSAEAVDYVRDIKPILKQRCFACHGALKQEAELRLDTAALMHKGGDSGSVIEPADAANSLLIERVAAEDEFERMPPEGEPLSPEQITLFKRWIDQGAKAPEDEQPEKDPREHWAFQRIVRPAVPVPEAKGEAGATGKEYRISSKEFRSEKEKETETLLPSSLLSRHSILQSEIDAFIAALHEQKGLTSQPPAPKYVLLRRVYLDLIGLPPTREELHDFLADESPSAYETVVNRLLNDPRHGERWARHWMDVWRYSDWYGRRHVPDVWNSAPQIWRWRDWIVKSLNQDHGYDRMLSEMLAADEIVPEDVEAGYATGYLIRNWYALNPNDWMRSTVEHTGKAFLGLTFNCAHCHDHKYDPIEQDDYFRLRAFFEPMYLRQDRVPGEADPGPFEDYNYGKLRKIQRLGAVRIFDKSPDASTWFYTGGDERNRVKERGSIPPGVPAFLADSLPEIELIQLPPRAWYPGLQPGIQNSLLNEARNSITASKKAILAAKKTMKEPSQAVRDQLEKAEATYAEAQREVKQTGSSGALAGQQSLFFDATAGRRILQNKLPGLKSLEDGFTLEFQLQILKDAHFNFQFAKDVVKGLTAGYVAFEKGRIISYQPGSFTEFEAGKYDFDTGQTRFHVKLVLQTKADHCKLSVRSLNDDNLLVHNVPVALNGWNPIGDPTKAISFDARTGSVAAIDELILTSPVPVGATTGTDPVRVAHFNFEAPAYPVGHDVVGLGNWEASPFSVAPASSIISSTAVNTRLQSLKLKVEAAQRAVHAPMLPLRLAESQQVFSLAELASIEARIAADRAKYGETPDADVAMLIRNASLLEREAAVRKSESEILSQEGILANAESKPSADAKRSKEIEAATKGLALANAALEKARKALADDSLAETYTAFSPTYPKTSTGRRRALAEWITSRENPLTARVAVNHIWLRHFHSPLVKSVNDFGRNGAEPSHPQLLDWLAVELIESGWSMKHIHHLIVTSAAYRRVSSSKGASESIKLDPENKFLWRMNSGRMEAEVIRDSLLYCAGKLDPKMGGQELENSDSLKTYRRSLYYSVYPEQGGKSPLGELFDGPDALDCYRRTRTIIPQQALALTNSDLVHEVSVAIVSEWEAEREREKGRGGEDETTKFIVELFEQILSRTPSDAEFRVCLNALRDHPELTVEITTRLRESVVRALLNHNDFVTVR